MTKWDKCPVIYLDLKSRLGVDASGEGGPLYIARLCEALGKVVSGEPLPEKVGLDERRVLATQKDCAKEEKV